MQNNHIFMIIYTISNFGNGNIHLINILFIHKENHFKIKLIQKYY